MLGQGLHLNPRTQRCPSRLPRHSSISSKTPRLMTMMSSERYSFGNWSRYECCGLGFHISFWYLRSMAGRRVFTIGVIKTGSTILYELIGNGSKASELLQMSFSRPCMHGAFDIILRLKSRRWWRGFLYSCKVHHVHHENSRFDFNFTLSLAHIDSSTNRSHLVGVYVLSAILMHDQKQCDQGFSEFL